MQIEPILSLGARLKLREVQTAAASQEALHVRPKPALSVPLDPVMTSRTGRLSTAEEKKAWLTFLELTCFMLFFLSGLLAALVSDLPLE